MAQHQELSDDHKEIIIGFVNAKSEYWRLLGMECIELEKGWARARLPFDRKLTNPTGNVHGGALFSLADGCAAVAAMTMVERGELVTTVEMKINYLKPFTTGEACAEAKIIHKGKNIALGDVDITNSQGELIAKGQATYMILKAKRAMVKTESESIEKDQMPQ